MGLKHLIGKLLVPAIFLGALFTAYAGHIPFDNDEWDEALTRFDVLVFANVTYVSFFLTLSGLGMAVVMYWLVSLVLWNRRQRALRRLGKLLQSGPSFRNGAAKRPTLTQEDQGKIAVSAKQIEKYVGIVSRPEVTFFRKINTFNPADHPPDVQIAVRGNNKLLLRSERLKRVEDFIREHSRSY